MATCGHTSRSHIDHAWPSPTHGLLQVRSCAFLLSAHGYCSKATFFRLFIKEKPGLIGAPNRPEWYQRNFGRSMDGEDGSAEDEAETDEDMDEGSTSTEEGEGEQQEQQACPCLPCEHGGGLARALLSLSTPRPRVVIVQFGGNACARAATVSLARAESDVFMTEHLKYSQSKGNPDKGVLGSFYTWYRKTGGRFGTPTSQTSATRGLYSGTHSIHAWPHSIIHTWPLSAACVPRHQPRVDLVAATFSPTRGHILRTCFSHAWATPYTPRQRAQVVGGSVQGRSH